LVAGGASVVGGVDMGGVGACMAGGVDGGGVDMGGGDDDMGGGVDDTGGGVVGVTVAGGVGIGAEAGDPKTAPLGAISCQPGTARPFMVPGPVSPAKRYSSRPSEVTWSATWPVAVPRPRAVTPGPPIGADDISAGQLDAQVAVQAEVFPWSAVKM
jgi:hypothetical protein